MQTVVSASHALFKPPVGLLLSNHVTHTTYVRVMKDRGENKVSIKCTIHNTVAICHKYMIMLGFDSPKLDLCASLWSGFDSQMSRDEFCSVTRYTGFSRATPVSPYNSIETLHFHLISFIICNS